MAELALGPEIDPGDGDAIRAWLARHDVPEADAQAIAADGLGPLLVYRRLVRGNLREALHASIPRTMARMGELFEDYFDRYLAERGPTTHYLRDLTPDFLSYCAPRFSRDDRVPPWMLDLARHEATQIDVGAMQAGQRDSEPAALDLSSPVRFIEAARLMRYEFAVHRLSEDEDDRTLPAAEPTSLFVYRSPDHEVRYLELTPLAAAILDQLLHARPLGEAIRRACDIAGAVIDQNLIERTARLLSDLAERGALLGAEPS